MIFSKYRLINSNKDLANIERILDHNLEAEFASLNRFILSIDNIDYRALNAMF
jgi:hypothetical protein